MKVSTCSLYWLGLDSPWHIYLNGWHRLIVVFLSNEARGILHSNTKALLQKRGIRPRVYAL